VRQKQLRGESSEREKIALVSTEVEAALVENRRGRRTKPEPRPGTTNGPG
jgi:hypothetical protein